MTEIAEPDRLVELVDGLTAALADMIRRHEVTEQEWYATLDFLGRVAGADELILLSDVIGLSVLVDRQSHDGRGGTASNVLGPFWRPAPELPNPAVLTPADASGEPLILRGVVVDADGDPVTGARLDVWQCDEHGRYDVQYDEDAPRFRGILTTGADGRYELRTVVPPPYEVPKSGPVGQLLAALGRHAHRPAHVHYRVQAPGPAELTTMVFFAGDPWLGNDVIDADRPELTVEIDRTIPVPSATFDIHLTRE